jgi:predicted RNA-binding Zn-ribbon protein involved in translation (DUF1610 family)
MSTFKSKPLKKKDNNNKYNVTLDVMYKNKINLFEKRKKHLSKKKNTLNKYNTELDELENKKSSGYTTEDIRRRSLLKTEIEKLNKEIYNIENNIDEMEFYEKTFDIIDSYYDIIENDKIRQNNKRDKKSINIVDYFNQKRKQKTDEKKINRTHLHDKFLYVTENINKNRKKDPVKNCKNCDIELIIHHSEGRYTCTNCGVSEEIIIDSDKPNYKDPIPDKKAYAYKRMNHFSEWLSQVQGRESTHIPDEVYNNILEELQKNRFTNLTKLDQDQVKDILKKLGLNKYYEHTTHIINKLSGLPPPNIPRDIEEKLKLMFRDIQEPFEKHRPSGRKNFLSYSYVLHKFCQLLELDEYLPFFKLLKSTEKLREQDRIWLGVCNSLKWEFIPSI